MLADSHTHLDLFTDDELEAMVSRAEAAGVGMIVCVGSTIESSRRAVELARRFDSVYAGVGMHPMDLKAAFTDGDYRALKSLAESSDKVVCVSETGLDFLDTSPDRGWQMEALRGHVRLAKELGKPLDFHAREAYDEILGVLKAEGAEETGAIWHYFLGDAEKAAEAIALGFYISLAKPLLLRPELAEAAKHIPLDRIVLETDSYPQPWKKNPARRTEPSHLPLVAEKLADLKGVGVADIEAATTANLKRALRLA